MIYFTGDTHGDEFRISKHELKMLKEKDTLIVCGDFGFVWNGGKNEKKILIKLQKRKYTICFVDGTHENFEILNSLPVTMWNGGKVHKIGSNIIHLMRGQVYNIENKTVFAMGGGENPELDLKNEDEITSRPEVPSKQEMLEGIANMEKNGYKVDYIVTHEPPAKIKDFLLLSESRSSAVTALGAYLDELAAQTEYKKWYFGSMHIDKHISQSMTGVFNSIKSAND